MPIKFTVIERSQPGVKVDGEKKWYATASNDGEMSIDDLLKQIEKFSALSEADIRGIIIALENVIQEALSNSKIVRLDKLGSLYTPPLSSEGAKAEKDFNQSMIKSVGVNYRTRKRILDNMKNAGFDKVNK